MSKHTPGPWTYELDVVNDGDINVFADGGPGGGIPGLPVASVDVRSSRHNEDGPPREEALANARLIAAAPELLEALQATVAHIDQSHDIADCEPWVIRVRAAIAKATHNPGESKS